MEKIKRYVPKHTVDDGAELYNCIPSNNSWLLAVYFVDQGMADTVAVRLANSILEQTKAVTSADSRNLKLMAEYNIEALLNARLYHSTYGEEGFSYESVLDQKIQSRLKRGEL